jgi:hypothetical protein
MHHLTKVKQINKLNDEELKSNTSLSASWHQQVSLKVIKK